MQVHSENFPTVNGNGSGHGPKYSSQLESRRKKRRPYRKQVQHGIRLAVLRANTAAQLCMRGKYCSLKGAARACGSTVPYVAAALIVIKSEDIVVQQRLLTGQLSLLETARRLRQQAALIGAYRGASATDRIKFAVVIGPTNLFENSVAPAL
jgi:hypothetical protein